jgi:PRC-barrel domain protein
MTQTLVALFDSYDDAAQTARRLEEAGVPSREISIVANPAGAEHVIPQGTTDDAAQGAGTGLAVGTALGGGAGLLAGLGLVAIPGLGPMIAAGWLAATAAGAAVGAAAGGIIGALTGAGLSDEDAHVYAEGLRRGGTLLTVRVEEGEALAAKGIIGRSPAVDAAARGQAYRAEGWTRFDETAPAEGAQDRSAERARASPGTSGGAQPGSASVNPLIASRRVVGTSIYDPNGKHLGTVERLMIDPGKGQVAYVVMAYGGLHGMGELTYPISWDTLTYDESLQGYRTTLSEDQIRARPS